MAHDYRRFFRPQPAVWLAAGLLLSCTEQPAPLTGVDSRVFTAVTSADPTRVLTVGVDAPANLVVNGAFAAIVVDVDNAVLDLAGATVDCGGGTSEGEPSIGVWIKNDRSHVRLTGRGSGVIRNCNIGVLIGQLDPNSTDPGGSANTVDGLVIPNALFNGGFYSGSAIVLSNSHDNDVERNHVSNVDGSVEGGIFVHGSDPAAAVSGRNTISGNTLEGGFNNFGIRVASNANVVRDNQSTGPIEGIVVEGDGNLVQHNAIGYFPDADQIFSGIRLLAGADDNTIADNDVRAHDYGILVDAPTYRNLIRKNAATTVGGTDAVDRSGACVNNTWVKNTFSTVDPECILTGGSN